MGTAHQVVADEEASPAHPGAGDVTPEDEATLEDGAGDLRASALSWALAIWAALARFFLVFQAVLLVIAVVPAVCGLKGYLVGSDSMRPLISAGDVVLTSEAPVEPELLLGRVVLVEPVAGGPQQAPLMHRVVGVAPEGGYVTAGDANPSADAQPARPSQITGIGVILVPWIGLPKHWLATGATGPLAAWAALLLAAIGTEALTLRTRRGGRGGRRRSRTAAAAGGTAVMLVALAGGQGAGAWMAFEPASAGFTAQTVNTGARWVAAAARPPAALVFASQPGDTTGGVPAARQPVVEVVDAMGAAVRGTRTIELSLLSSSGTLACESTRVTTSSGSAAFSGCQVDRAGAYRLVATSGDLRVTSEQFTVSVGPPSRLRFSTTPGTTPAATKFAAQPVVDILDAGGNLTTTYLPVSLTVGGATLACNANPQVADRGQARFDRCQLDHAGTFTLTATSGGLTPATSGPIVITAPQKKELSCSSSVWYATFGWSPTPQVPTTYRLYVNGVQVQATGADGWNSYVQLTSQNVPASSFPEGTATVRVVKVLADGGEDLIGTGSVQLGPAGHRTYLCGNG